MVALSNLPMLLYNKYMYAKFRLSLVLFGASTRPTMSFMPEIA